MRKGQQKFYVEITDLFADQPNYSWVTRHKVTAKTPMGAIRKVNRAGGIQFKREYDFGDYVRYKSKSGATCAFIENWDDTMHNGLSNVKTDLE
jgi:hypothetical protein